MIFGQTARIKGIVLDKNNHPVENVNISCLSITTKSNHDGFYDLKVPANQKVTVVFSHVSLKKVTVYLTLAINENKEFNPVMSDQEEQMSEVLVDGSSKKLFQNGIDIEQIVNRSMLSPATCCLVNPDKGQTVEDAFSMVNHLSQMLREKYKMV